MTKSTSRRRLLKAGAASVAALGTLGATSTLLGRSKARTNMQAEAKTPVQQLRPIEQVLTSSSQHWVGDGFYVRSVIAPDGDPQLQSPFLLLDHAARRRFEPTGQKRGVGEHPHRGFETVTFAYKGEIEHRDSSGGGGTIGPGDVQWMTAASGVVHEEKHSQRFTEQGGELEMVQLWVNLPAKSKMSTPGYQALLDADFPRLTLGAARARLIAGSLAGARGPARTHTPITIFDLQFERDGELEFALPAEHNSFVFPLEGEIKVGSEARALTPGHLALLQRGHAGAVRLQAGKDARVLVLSGEPIDEPVAAYGPFVMNTREQIMAAMRDYQSGKMGHLSAR
jgi:redox-sensitive bicupin YhaK (pirin superfamily)